MNQKKWRDNLVQLLKKFGISTPKSISLYMEALTHSSYSNECGLKYNYERLEFLGDAAIDWVIVNYLYSRKPLMNEGEMSIKKSSIVRRETLVKACKDIELNKLMLVGNSISNELAPDKILEDIFESFIGAVAQDQGIKKVSNILHRTIIKYFEHDDILTEKDYKTQFQEFIQASKVYQPLYEHIDGKIKISKLYCKDNNGNKFLYGEGKAQNFKQADQIAAKMALDKMVKTNRREERH